MKTHVQKKPLLPIVNKTPFFIICLSLKSFPINGFSLLYCQCTIVACLLIHSVVLIYTLMLLFQMTLVLDTFYGYIVVDVVFIVGSVIERQEGEAMRH